MVEVNINKGIEMDKDKEKITLNCIQDRKRLTCPFDTFFQELVFVKQILEIFSIVHFQPSFFLILPIKKFDFFLNVVNVGQLSVVILRGRVSNQITNSNNAAKDLLLCKRAALDIFLLTLPGKC